MKLFYQQIKNMQTPSLLKKSVPFILFILLMTFFACTKENTQSKISLDPYDNFQGRTEPELWEIFNDSQTKINTSLQTENFEMAIEAAKVSAEVAFFLKKQDIEILNLDNIVQFSINKLKKEGIEKLIANYYSSGNQEKFTHEKNLKNFLTKNAIIFRKARLYSQKIENIMKSKSEQNIMNEKNLTFLNELEDVFVSFN